MCGVPLDLHMARGTNVTIKFLKERAQPPAPHRRLDPRWRVVYQRWDLPTDLDLSQFPHLVNVVNSIQAQNWCTAHVGVIDQAWTYTDSDSVRFRDLDHAIQFKLSL